MLVPRYHRETVQGGSAVVNEGGGGGQDVTTVQAADVVSIDHTGAVVVFLRVWVGS